MRTCGGRCRISRAEVETAGLAQQRRGRGRPLGQRADVVDLHGHTPEKSLCCQAVQHGCHIDGGADRAEEFALLRSAPGLGFPEKPASAA